MRMMPRNRLTRPKNNMDAYDGRNPRTGKIVEVKPKKLPFFKAGKELKGLVDTKEM